MIVDWIDIEVCSLWLILNKFYNKLYTIEAVFGRSLDAGFSTTALSTTVPIRMLRSLDGGIDKSASSLG